MLEQVAVAAGLYTARASSSSSSAAVATASLPQVVQQLESSLTIAPVRKTTFIKLIYRSSDPTRAARVLAEIGRLYPEKHLALHRPPGAYEFFSAQAERFKTELHEAEASLKEFGRHEQVVSADVEKGNTLQRLADFEASLQQVRGSIADATRRIAQLEADAASTPARQTTQVRTSDNNMLTSQLKSRILDLEVKRADMLRKFAPTYVPLTENEQELTQARAALAQIQQVPLVEETTDQIPTYQWLSSELARVKSERAAAMARAGSLADSVRLYREKARQLDEKAATQQTLLRSMKSAEDNYLMYLRKQEEARISDALDRTRITNVAIVEAPTVPSAPANTGRTWILFLGGLMALAMGLATTYLLDYFSPHFHTPDEVERSLDIAVLATLPARR